MKANPNKLYLIEFDPITKEQISYIEATPTTPIPTGGDRGVERLFRFDPLQQKLSLDTNGNIQINSLLIPQPGPEGEVTNHPRVEHSDTIKALHYTLAYSFKTRIIDVSLRGNDYTTYIQQIEQSLDFKIDDTMNELMEEVERVKLQTALGGK